MIDNLWNIYNLPECAEKCVTLIFGNFPIISSVNLKIEEQLKNFYKRKVIFFYGDNDWMR